jgi:beta-glucosidase
VQVGASSREIRLTVSLELAGQPAANPYDRERFQHYYSADVFHIEEDEFARLLDRPLPEANWDESAPLGFNDTLSQGSFKKGVGRFFLRVIRLLRAWFLFRRQPIMANNMMFALEVPYRHLHRMTGGVIDRAMLDALLVMVNGEFWKGLRQLRRAKQAKDQREGRAG